MFIRVWEIENKQEEKIIKIVQWEQTNRDKS